MASSDAAEAQHPQRSSQSLSFRDKLEARIAATNSLLCVGLDPHEAELNLLPPVSVSDEEKCRAAFTFCKNLVDATRDVACCYKPNAAFFEALGDGGSECLRRVVCDVIPSDVPVLLDCKRGDIGSTAAAYASACYEHFHAVDAVTLSPLMGWDSVSPFVTEKYAGKGAFLLCKTSNPGSKDLLNLPLKSSSSSAADNDDERLYERIAKLVGGEWSLLAAAASEQQQDDEKAKASNIMSDSAAANAALVPPPRQRPLLGLVVGATDLDALSRARQAAGDEVWILAPGVGAQGGDLRHACRAGMNKAATGLLIPVSRGISTAADPAGAAREFCAQIQAVRAEILAITATAASGASAATDSEAAAASSMIRPYQKDFLDFSLQQGVLNFGSFVLKSGRTSPYFFNAGLFASGAALYKLGKAYASTIMASNELSDGKGGVKFDVIFGPAYKGIPLGAVVSSALYSDFGVDVGFAYNRKEAKDHGEGGCLVGVPMEGKRVLVVDDVITAGTAIREAHDMLKAVGAEPVGVVIALDRAEIRALDDKVSAVQAVVRDLSIKVVSIVNLKELQMFLEQSKDYDDKTLQSVINYRKEYGAA